MILVFYKDVASEALEVFFLVCFMNMKLGGLRVMTRGPRVYEVYEASMATCLLALG